MNNVIKLDQNTRLRLVLTKAAETSLALAHTVRDPARRERLVALAEHTLAKARAV